MNIYNVNGELVRAATPQEEQVYMALGKWAERLNKWEYSIQLKRNKMKRLKTFSPNEFSLDLINAQNQMINQRITPEEAMSIIHSPQGRAERRMCMDAGY